MENKLTKKILGMDMVLDTVLLEQYIGGNLNLMGK